jgi:hypothetical protein
MARKFDRMLDGVDQFGAKRFRLFSLEVARELVFAKIEKLALAPHSTPFRESSVV